MPAFYEYVSIRIYIEIYVRMYVYVSILQGDLNRWEKQDSHFPCRICYYTYKTQQSQ